jgi:DNA-binding transcriptional LysR family regulator
LNRNRRATSLTEIGVEYYEKCKDVMRGFEEAAPLLVEFMRAHPTCGWT